MGSLRTEHLSGIVVPYPGIQDLESTLNSSYTTADPRPGFPTPSNTLATLEPVISGAQNADMVLTVIRGGAPGISKGSVQIGYRYSTETVSEVRGWQAGNALMGFDAIDFRTTATTDYFDAVTHPDSQKVLVAYGDGGAAPFLRFARYDPATATWTTLGTLNNSTPQSVTLVALPTGRILCISYGLTTISRSDDVGSTWTPHGGNPTAIILERMRAAYSDGEILLLGLSLGTDTLNHYVSTDGGVSFTSVETIAGFGTKLSVAALPDGRLVIGYKRTSDGKFVSRTIGSASSLISLVSDVVVETNTVIDCALCADTDGILWGYATISGNTQRMNAYVSFTGGNGWTQTDYGAARVSTLNTTAFRPVAAVISCSQSVVICKHTAPVDTHGESLWGVLVGGWSDVTYHGVSVVDRYGFGFNAGTSGLSWFPIELPQNAGWTVTGTAANGTIVTGRLQIATAASLCHYSFNLGTQLKGLVYFGVTQVAGGLATTRDIACTFSCANGVNEYRLDLRILAAGIRIVDASSGGTLQDVVIDMTTETEVLVAIDNTAGVMLWRKPSSATWTLGWSGVIGSKAGPAANGIVDFGNITNATATSRWKLVAFLEGGSLDRAAVGTTPLGRPIGPDPVPMHAEVQTNGVVGRLSALGGLGALNETYSVPADYDRPPRSIYPEVSPSPAQTWRSVDKSADMIFGWSLPANRDLYGQQYAIIAMGCNFRQAFLERNNGGWATVATLDLSSGFTGLNYSLSTSMVLPAVGGSAPDRFIQEGELAGSYLVSAGAAYLIDWNTGGVWNSSASTRQVRIYLNNPSGLAASGSCDLTWSNGIALAYQATSLAQTAWRIRIPAAQVTPWNYYQAGILCPAVFRAFGAPHDWGRSRESLPQVSMTRSPYGTSYTRETGPPLRTLTMSWAEGGVDLTTLRSDAAPDYVGISGQLPMGAAEDVPWLLEGLQRLTKSGAIPVVPILAAPATSKTITDPSLFLWSRLASSVGTDLAVGHEGSNEVERPIAITFEEIR